MLDAANALPNRCAVGIVSGVKFTSTAPELACRASPYARSEGAVRYQQQEVNSPMRTNYIQPNSNGPPLRQLQGGDQCQASLQVPRQAVPCQRTRAAGNAVSDLLPHCTTEPPLRTEEVFALTDAVGSLKDLVLLALGAASGDTGCVERLESAVGQRAASTIAEFFIDEWEIEG